MPLTVSPATLNTAGVLLIAIVAVEWGGTYLLALARGRRTATPFQITFARAGHAHAGVLVILSLVSLLYVDASGATGLLGSLARQGIPLAAILMPLGFFLSSAGKARSPWGSERSASASPCSPPSFKRTFRRSFRCHSTI